MKKVIADTITSKLYHNQLFFLSKVTPPVKSWQCRHTDDQKPINWCDCHRFENRLKRRIINDHKHQQKGRHNGADQVHIPEWIAFKNRPFTAAVKHMNELRQNECAECNRLRILKIVRITVIHKHKG